MQKVLVLNGQTNYDICLQLYGGLDRLVKLCVDNNISDINTVSKNYYYFDENYIVNKKNIGYKYSTSVTNG